MLVSFANWRYIDRVAFLNVNDSCGGPFIAKRRPSDPNLLLSVYPPIHETYPRAY